ncbi:MULTISPECIES: hypothetical protein [Paenibacillus]|uniref:hypothetical protein n=1 Tax=Paenibacillus TaxID=44249 RepID=UPI002024BF1A|nr:MULTISPECIES: hypothetical protein [Paenibacillus]MCP3746689.1 hypothetical protein [Paenibacillus sp. A3M_27_13]URJ45188.1 hypothetical protein MF628_004973 [Paenibacillus polymyxa]
MSDLILDLHDAMFKNTIWPNDLLHNLADPDYLSINFNAYLDGMCAEVVFMDEGKRIVTNYYFNKKNYIQKIEMIENGESIILYDRLVTIAEILTKLGRSHELEKTLKLLAA